MQPTYLPWLGYFDMIDQVDTFVFFDDVQLVKRSWGVRNRIKTANGELMLTVPVKKTKSRDETLYSNAKINYEEKWISKHLNSIKRAYSKSKYFSEIFPVLENLISVKYNSIADLNITIIKSIASKLGISTNFLRSSELEGIEGTKDERLVSVCKKIKADYYLSARGSAEYIEKNTPGGAFGKSGIKLYYHNYEHPQYNQLFGEFIPFMSVVDLIFNEGFEKGLEIIRSGRREPLGYLDFRKSMDIVNENSK